MSDLIRRDCTRTSPHGRHFWMIGEEYLSCPGSIATGGSAPETIKPPTHSDQTGEAPSFDTAGKD